MLLRPASLALALCAAFPAHATNGMNIEGYGPIAAAMGGASFAHDNGTAAMMNNPATLALSGPGHRIDGAIGFLGPDVEVVGGQRSGGDAYFMPAAGWVSRSGSLVYGLGVYAQGGMGTDYARGMDGLPERSELGVGRVIAPLAWNVNERLNLGATAELVWAMLDLRMAMPMGQLAGLIVEPGNGTLTGALGGLGGAGYDTARLDFSDDNDFTGEAKSVGVAGKLGFTYQVSPALRVGGTYHAKTRLGDMETGVDDAALVARDIDGPAPEQRVPGRIIVRDFQWPETYGLGLAFQPAAGWLVAADWKRINWADDMQDFTMTYVAAGDAVTFKLPQNWKNQNVWQLGVAWNASPVLTLRGGASFAKNPVPDETMHYLFPAIPERHVMAGFGYRFAAGPELNASLQHAPAVEVANPVAGYRVSHGQSSAQLMLSWRF